VTTNIEKDLTFGPDHQQPHFIEMPVPNQFPASMYTEPRADHHHSDNRARIENYQNHLEPS
jgi:hypothetical protein